MFNHVGGVEVGKSNLYFFHMVRVYLTSIPIFVQSLQTTVFEILDHGTNVW